jgi:hypothetical protein
MAMQALPIISNFCLFNGSLGREQAELGIHRSQLLYKTPLSHGMTASNHHQATVHL